MRIFSIPRGWLLVPLALAAALALPHRAAAQQCTEEPCGPFDGTPPTVTVSPSNGATLGGGQTLVTINWSDNLGLDATSRSIVFDGVNVDSAFNWTNLGYSVIPVSARSEGYVDVGPGSHTFSATICDLSNEGPFCRTATATWNGPAASVRVTASSAPLTVPGGDSAVARYRVVNTGTATTQYALSATCTGGLSGCAPSVTTAKIAAGDSTIVDVAFAATGTGNVRLTAASGAVSGYADVAVSALAAVDHGFPGDSVSLMRIEREHCFTASMGPGIAWDCGSARIVHSLPGVRALNKARVPVLVYNHDHARPVPTVAGHITPLAGTTPDSIKATLTVNGSTWPGSWPGWASTQTRRIAIAFDASGLNTGVYPYTWVVTAHYNNGAPAQTLVAETRRLVVVNRVKSPFGKGWWLSGVERLEHLPGDTLKLWVGGDGSARLYRGPTTGPWTAQGLDRLETLKKVTGPTGAEEFERLLSGGAKVYFNTWGEHIRTVNTLGHVTTFTWTGPSIDDRRLESITLPATPDNPSPLQYTFEYNNNTATGQIRRLSRVVSPGPVDYRYTHVLTDNAARVTRITDPDSGAVQYGYGSSLALITQRTDRRNGIQRLDYQSNRFQGLYARPHPDSAETRILLSDPKRLGQRNTPSVRADSVLMILDGARTEFCDCVYWSVNRYGAPLSMRDPYGKVTTYQRGDPRWPGRVTRVTAPNGFTSTAAYDANGYLAATTAWNPYDDGRDATTLYEWDTRWDAVTRVTLPEGETSLTQYDALGRREWDQAGTSASRRVTYAYNPSTHARAPGLVESVTSPATATSPASTERYEYDARGNLNAVVSPRQIRTDFLLDRLGRVTRTQSPVDVNGVSAGVQSDSTVYDIADQVVTTVSTGPAMNGVVQQWLWVRNEYDPEGNVKAVSRWSDPDAADVDTVVTRFEYDLMGRRTAEVAPDGKRDETFYDRAGNPVRVRTRRYAEFLAAAAGDSASAYITSKYDANNRLIERQVPSVRYAERKQGIAGGDYAVLLKQRAYPYFANDGTGLRLPRDTMRYGYDAMGNMLLADNRDAQVRRGYYPGGALKGDTLRTRTVAELSAGGTFASHDYALLHVYDRNGRRVELHHPQQLAPRVNGAVQPTRFAYDPAIGALSRVTDPLGNAFQYQYDVRGRQEALYRPGGINEFYGFDADGNVTSHRVQNANSVAYRYPGSWIRDETLQYDWRGKMARTGNLYGHRDTVTVQYSGLGHMSSTTQRYHGYTFSTDQDALYVDSETPQHDALGNIYRMGRSGELRVFEKSWLDAGSSESSTSTTLWQYQRGTGRLLLRSTPSGADSTHYDAAGNIVFTSQWATPGATAFDRVAFYDAEDRLRVSETRRLESYGARTPPFYQVFEEYRYDALGRRVLVYARKDCELPSSTQNHGPCAVGTLSRTVWDGSAELYEIRVPVSTSPYSTVNIFFSPEKMENDTAWVAAQGLWDGYDPHPMWGRVAYTYGHSIDQPLSVVRMKYADHRTDAAGYFRWEQPFAIFPHWNLRGAAQTGTFANGARDWCLTVSGVLRCVAIDWPEGWFPYNPVRPIPEHWHGSLLQEKRDGSGLLYRRNRYYDPSSARFTQEDPIGLAGGINAYGFAAGDPVNYSDPFGLRPLNAHERGRLGDMCDQINCNSVEVYDGNGSAAENRRRARVLSPGKGRRSVALGHDIYLSDGDVSALASGDITPLAHEMTHVWQYERWGRGRYYGTAAQEQARYEIYKLRGRGTNPYALPNLSGSMKGFLDYGMEQQAEIVANCYSGSANACIFSPFTP